MFIDVAVNIGVMAIILTIISLIITVILVIARKKQWKKALFTAGISFLIIFIAGFSAKFYQMHEDTVGGSLTIRKIISFRARRLTGPYLILEPII